MAAQTPVALIFIGNQMRGDDDAGLEVGRRLRDFLPDWVEPIFSRGQTTELLALWHKRRAALIIDTVSGAGQPGDLLIYEDLSELPEGLDSASTEDFSFAEARRLGSMMGDLPDRLFFLGLVGEQFDIGDPISARVEATIDRTIGRIISILAGLAPAP